MSRAVGKCQVTTGKKREQRNGDRSHFRIPRGDAGAIRKYGEEGVEGAEEQTCRLAVKGVLAHMAGPMPNGWRVVDVWQSEAAFKRFGKVLMPILKESGLPDVEPKFFPLVRFIKG
jgi:hypothetical protein